MQDNPANTPVPPRDADGGILNAATTKRRLAKRTRRRIHDVKLRLAACGICDEAPPDSLTLGMVPFCEYLIREQPSGPHRESWLLEWLRRSYDQGIIPDRDKTKARRFALALKSFNDREHIIDPVKFSISCDRIMNMIGSTCDLNDRSSIISAFTQHEARLRRFLRDQSDPLDECEVMCRIANIHGAHYQALPEVASQREAFWFAKTALDLGECQATSSRTKGDAKRRWRKMLHQASATYVSTAVRAGQPRLAKREVERRLPELTDQLGTPEVDLSTKRALATYWLGVAEEEYLALEKAAEAATAVVKTEQKIAVPDFRKRSLIQRPSWISLSACVLELHLAKMSNKPTQELRCKLIEGALEHGNLYLLNRAVGAKNNQSGGILTVDYDSESRALVLQTARKIAAEQVTLDPTDYPEKIELYVGSLLACNADSELASYFCLDPLNYR